MLLSIGDIGRNPDEHYKVPEIREDAKNIFKKLFFNKSRFCGGILMGDVSKSVKMIKVYEDSSNFNDPVVQKLLS